MFCTPLLFAQRNYHRSLFSALESNHASTHNSEVHSESYKHHSKTDDSTVMQLDSYF